MFDVLFFLVLVAWTLLRDDGPPAIPRGDRRPQPAIRHWRRVGGRRPAVRRPPRASGLS